MNCIRTLHWVVAGVAAALLAAPTSAQTIIYVDDDFNESTPGWGVDHFADIQDAVNNSQPNGSIVIGNGTYEETINQEGATLGPVSPALTYEVFSDGELGIQLAGGVVVVAGLQVVVEIPFARLRQRIGPPAPVTGRAVVARGEGLG